MVTAQTHKEIAIIGAGPSGLSMAIFLHELGCQPVIFDRKSHISPHSKALGVNPRSLEILKPYGVTDQFLQNGRQMTAVNLWWEDQHIYTNDFSKVKTDYPFMLIQPQKESEEILLAEVQSRGIQVNYSAEFIEYVKADDKYQIAIKDKDLSSKAFDHIVGADGGHSRVRQQAQIDYLGYRYDEEWELYDVEIDMEVHADEGHIRLFPNGGMIMISLHDNVWRIAGNMKSILEYLPRHSVVGHVHWESTFQINHKVADNLVNEGVVIIGDAAHLHSPVGARGMNLGIEDAYIGSRLIAEDRLQEYTNLRTPYLKSTVKRINSITMGMVGTSTMSRILRRQVRRMKPVLPLVMPRVRNFILGLDQ